MFQLLKFLITSLYNILPSSPFSGIADGLNRFGFLSYLNWFIPFDVFSSLMIKWCVVVAVIYQFDIIKGIVNGIIKKLTGG